MTRRIDRDEKTATQVQLLAGFGLTVLEIAKVIGMSQPTMHKLYMPELENGHILANAKVVQSLFQMATHPVKPVPSCAIFWCKARMGWRDDGGEPIGKKEAADLIGKVADKNTKWDGLLS
jgi:hypothetical protein